MALLKGELLLGGNPLLLPVQVQPAFANAVSAWSKGPLGTTIARQLVFDEAREEKVRRRDL